MKASEKISKEKMIQLAQGQLDAYNRRDLEKFCSHYHPLVKVYQIGSNEMTCENLDQFREIYRKRFDSSPGLHCQLKSRIVLETKVLDEEWVTTDASPEGSHVVAIYGFQDQLISHVWFAR